MKSSLVLLLAGSGNRFGESFNKALLKINNIPLYMYSLNTFNEVGIDEFILVVSISDESIVKEYISNTIYNNKVKFVIGGSERFESVKNALKKVTGDIVYIHDAARPCVNKNDILDLMASSNNFKLGALVKKPVDTLRDITNNDTLNRDNVALMSTPQYFKRELFDVILNNSFLINDEITLFKNELVSYIYENYPNPKLTYKSDLDYITFLLANKFEYRVGHSLDYHPFKDSGILVLGGEKFYQYHALDGHSDADVVYHAVTESLLGASSLGDLGTLYPDTCEKFKGIDSGILLKDTVSRLESLNIKIENIDVMVYLIKPSLKDFKVKMAENIKNITNAVNVTVKAATLNKKGLISLEEGIGAEATSLVKIIKK